jgi:hypothetical protein
MNQLTRENFALFLHEYLQQNHLSVRRVAAAIGCSEPTLARVLLRVTIPSDEMIREGAFVMELGFERYSKLSRAQREKLSDALGTVGAGTLGFASISAAISSLGVAGLSAAGISSGLAALGAVIGGGMVAGVTVAAALPVAAASTGYGVARGIKGVAMRRRLNQQVIDLRWESLPGSGQR